ncbi:MAG: DegT/DnrJ/EryC1/StrS family aminotransferase, partial [Methanobacterium sp.]
DMDPIMEFAEDYDLFVVEDAAEVHGAEYKGIKAGGIGDIGCFSFYANKIITTGEGGMVVTNNKEIAEKVNSLKNLAFSKERRFLHDDIGFNYRMTNIQAAIGVAQLEKIDEFVEMRRRNAIIYNKYLEDIKGIRLPVEKPWAKNVYWMYSILIEDDFGISRDELMEKLREKGIETRTFFVPMHEQPVFHHKGLFKAEKYPVAEEISRKGIYLPSTTVLEEKKIKYITDMLNEEKKD